MVLKDLTEIWINDDLLVMVTVSVLFNLFYMLILTEVESSTHDYKFKFPLIPWSRNLPPV